MPVPPYQRPSLTTTAGDHEARIRALERRPPGTWVYVGTFPGDPDTTVDSPPFENGWSNAGGGRQRLRFRRTNENQTEFDGFVTGGDNGTVVTTLPDAIYIPLEEQEASGFVDGTPCRWVLRTDGGLVFHEGECCTSGVIDGGSP